MPTGGRLIAALACGQCRDDQRADRLRPLGQHPFRLRRCFVARAEPPEGETEALAEIPPLASLFEQRTAFLARSCPPPLAHVQGGERRSRQPQLSVLTVLAIPAGQPLRILPLPGSALPSHLQQRPRRLPFPSASPCLCQQRPHLSILRIDLDRPQQDTLGRLGILLEQEPAPEKLRRRCLGCSRPDRLDDRFRLAPSRLVDRAPSLLHSFGQRNGAHPHPP